MQIFSFTMLISFFSLFLSYNILTIKKKNVSYFQEDLYLAIYFCFLVAKYSEIKIKNIGAASFNTIIDKCAIFGFTAKNNCVKIATFLLNKFFVIKNDVKTTPVQDNREIILPARNGSPKRSPNNACTSGPPIGAPTIDVYSTFPLMSCFPPR